VVDLGKDTTICDGTSLILDASAAGRTYLWSTSETSPVIAASSAGNYSITVSDKAGCQGNDDMKLKINPLPLVEANEATVCTGESAVLHATGALTYEWEGLGKGNDFVIAPSETTTYYVIGTDQNGCKNEAEVEIVVHKFPNVRAEISEEKVLQGESVVMTPITNSSDIVLEELPSGTILYEGETAPVYLVPDSSSNYLLTGLLNNCPDTANLSVNVIDLIKVPSMITPNGDGLNDVWIIENIDDYPDVEISVFNRWGNTVFHQYGYENTFEGKIDGDDLPSSVYYYVIKLNFRDFIYKGSLTIMR